MRPSIVPVAVLLLSMVSGGAAAQQWTGIRQYQSVIEIVLPDLSNPVEGFSWRSRANYSGIDNFAMVKPRNGVYPAAQVFYTQVNPGYSVQTVPEIGEAWLRLFSDLKDKPLSLGEALPPGAFGAGVIRRFEVEHARCIGFSLAPDGVVDRHSHGGRKRVEGYYCGMPGIQLTDRDIQAVLYGIRIFDKPGGPLRHARPRAADSWTGAEIGPGDVSALAAAPNAAPGRLGPECGSAWKIVISWVI
jgi:hypothetical protein